MLQEKQILKTAIVHWQKFFKLLEIPLPPSLLPIHLLNLARSIALLKFAVVHF